MRFQMAITQAPVLLLILFFGFQINCTFSAGCSGFRLMCGNCQYKNAYNLTFKDKCINFGGIPTFDDGGATYVCSSSTAVEPAASCQFPSQTLSTQAQVITFCDAMQCLATATTTVCEKLITPCTTTTTCFSEMGVAIIDKAGSTKLIKDLDIGDMVMSVDINGNIFFDKVFRVAHYDPFIEENFVRIQTEDAHVLEISGDHLLYVGGCCDIGSKYLTQASAVKHGDTVYVITDSIMHPSTVTKIDTVRRKGVYNVHVLGGTVIVNGVVATHYIQRENMGMLNRLMTLWHPVQNYLFPSKDNLKAAVALNAKRTLN